MRRELFVHFLSSLGLLLVLSRVVWETFSLHGELGTATIIIAAAKTFQSNLAVIMNSIADQWNNAKGVILIEKDFLGTGPQLQTIDPVIPHWQGIPKIVVDKVSFAYPKNNTLVLKEVSFEIKPGEKVAIVGKSGSGKSSIYALLMRIYDPTSGNIFVGDINLRNIDPQEWMNHISGLSQDYAIQERTLDAEISSSNLDKPLDMEDLTASARFAHFAEVAENEPNGYKMQLGTHHGGRELAGGERQRLALTRTHYRNKPIMIFDEPDSRLDPVLSEQVMRNIFSLKDTSVVIITHHVSQAEHCDKIIVLSEGEIVEMGSHSELLANNGKYATMFRIDKDRANKS